ncbi:MAG: hypothetical protein AAGA54_24850 [Myxococcota bacterium]
MNITLHTPQPAIVTGWVHLVFEALKSVARYLADQVVAPELNRRTPLVSN